MSKPSTAKDKNRPPLTALDTSAERDRSIRMDNASDVSDLQQVSLFDFGESEFELMHVTVTVHNLTGLLSDQKPAKKKKSGPLSPKGKKKIIEESNPESSATSSLSSSSRPSRTGKGTIPTTTAVASFGRNVCNSQTSIMTHLPSLPLGVPTSSFGYVDRYMAQWYEPKPPILQEEDEVDPQSSFTFLRVMMREMIDLGEKQASTNMSSYVHETIDIQINLSQGKEIIPLGVATLAITGEEEGSVEMSIPAKPVVFKGKKLVVGEKPKGNGLFKKKVKRASFPSDPSRTFYLDEHATLRVSVMIIPQEAINDAKAREQARDIRRQMQMQRELEKLKDENSIVHQEPQKAKAHGSAKSSHVKSLVGTEASKQTMPPSVLRPSLFCGGCTALGGNKTTGQKSGLCLQKGEKELDDYTVASSTIDNIVQEKFGYSLASSVLSSVSESESESEESEEGDGDIHLNRKIFVRRAQKTPR